MARADLLLDIVRAGAENNQELFRKALEALVAEERAKQHNVLADQLAAHLRINGSAGRSTRLLSEPTGDRTAFTEVRPRRDLASLVLPSAVLDTCTEIVEEHHRADLLRSHGLEPRHRVLLSGPPGIRKQRELLQNQYAYVNGDGKLDAGDPSLVDVDALLDNARRGQRFSKTDLEKIARKLQRALWNRRASLSPEAKPQPVEVIDPEFALESIGFTVRPATDLGFFEGVDQVSEGVGLIDRTNSEVQVSDSLAAEVRRFTLAHELGHAVLHQQSGLHRDRALDGSRGTSSLDPVEREANMFAGYFLMPRNIVREEFETRFGVSPFVLSEAAAFALGATNLASMQRQCPTLRDLSRLLASGSHFGAENFESLAQHFRVSVGAMSIRLEELWLVTSPR